MSGVLTMCLATVVALVLTGCVDSSVEPQIKPAGEAVLQWTVDTPGSTMSVSSDGRAVMLSSYLTDYIPRFQMLDASSATDITPAYLSDQTWVSMSPNARYVVSLKRVANQKIIISIFDKVSGELVKTTSMIVNNTEAIAIAGWNALSTEVTLIVDNVALSGIFRFSVAGSEPLQHISEMPPVDFWNDRVRITPLARSHRIQLTGSLLFDPVAGEIVRASSQERNLVWPHPDGSRWFVCRENQIELLSASGKVDKMFPLAIAMPGSTVSVFASSPTASPSGRYLSVQVDQGGWDDVPELWIIDTRDATHVCHIPLPDLEYYQDVEVVFDPADERNMFLNIDQVVSKWRIE